MKSVIVVLVALVTLTGFVVAEEIICQDVIKDPKAIDTTPLVDFNDSEKNYLTGGFFFNKTGIVYHLNFAVLMIGAKKPEFRELILRDENCGYLKLQYLENVKSKTFKAQSAQLLLKQTNGNLVLDCIVRDPDLYFKVGKKSGKQFIDCYDASGANVTKLIVNKFDVGLSDKP